VALASSAPVPYTTLFRSGVYLGIGLRPDALDSDDGVMRVSEGRLPEADDEIAITEFTAQEAGLGVGDTMTVYVTSIHSASEYRIDRKSTRLNSSHVKISY